MTDSKFAVENAVAIGPGAHVTGSGGIALGANTIAGENELVIRLDLGRYPENFPFEELRLRLEPHIMAVIRQEIVSHVRNLEKTLWK